MNYETILGKWIPKDWSQRELKTITKSEVYSLIFEDTFSTTSHQKKNLHKMLKRIFEMAIEEGTIDKNPVKGIKIMLPSSKQKILTVQEADKLLKEAKVCNHRFYCHWVVALFTGKSMGSRKKNCSSY